MKKRATAIHEAAHVVVCRALELPISEAHLKPDESSGHVRFADALHEELAGSLEGADTRWNVVVATVAGGLAECLSLGLDPSDNRDRYSDGDMEIIVDLGSDFAPLSDGEVDLDALVEKAERQAARILVDRWDEVLGIASNLQGAIHEEGG